MSKSSLAPGAGDGFNKVIYKSQYSVHFRPYTVYCTVYSVG